MLLLLNLSVAFANPQKILIIGDSLSSGYGLNLNEGWAVLLQKKLKSKRCHYTVINDSISGDTTSNGLARLPKALKKYQPGIVIIELGGNDGLRALSPTAMRLNLNEMVTLSQKAGAKVLLLGVRIPPNYGNAYISRYRKVFFTIAKKKNVLLVAKILNNIGGNTHLMQSDGIHPNAKAQPILLQNVWNKLKLLLKC